MAVLSDFFYPFPVQDGLPPEAFCPLRNSRGLFSKSTLAQGIFLVYLLPDTSPVFLLCQPL